MAVVRFIGKMFISAGVSILLFLGYQLFGTNLVTENRQEALAKDLKPSAATEAPPAVAPEPDFGSGIARIKMPKIESDWVVVEGVTLDVLKNGPGHYPKTAMPGYNGNVVISGHRTTYGAPFYRLDEMSAGDEIILETRYGRFVYKVTEAKIVQPTDLTVVVESEDARLTLTTCHPRFSAAKRLIVVAALQGQPIGTETAVA